tara:strand:- start:2410 stop:2967 length:558 start_codon:yes stop_codon:yes gene_type:complete
MARRDLPEINAGSMADIAFLLLIFFLVTTTMDIDTGIKRKLPPLPDENNQPQESQMLKNNILVIQIATNKDIVLLETGAQESGQGYPFEVNNLKNFIKDFVDNKGRDSNLSESPDKAVISIKSGAKAHWGTFIAVQDAISAAYKELRNEESIKLYAKKYEDLNEDENSEVKKIYPLKLTESVKEN